MVLEVRLVVTLRKDRDHDDWQDEVGFWVISNLPLLDLSGGHTSKFIL